MGDGRIFVGVGSSLGDAEETFAQAERALAARGVRVVAQAKNLKNAPMGGVALEEFTNSVWEVATTQSPWELLRTLQAVEGDLGRVRTVRWGDRTLDLDLLVYGGLVLNTPELTLPHPRIGEREFVLGPWAEIVDEGYAVVGVGAVHAALRELKEVAQEVPVDRRQVTDRLASDEDSQKTNETTGDQGGADADPIHWG